jgi:hypothetical protein
MSRRGKPAAGNGAERRGLFERIIFSFMGPPQLGDVNAPIRASTRPVQLCPKCGKPYEDHQLVRTAGFTYTRCPTD